MLRLLHTTKIDLNNKNSQLQFLLKDNSTKNSEINKLNDEIINLNQRMKNLNDNKCIKEKKILQI